MSLAVSAGWDAVGQVGSSETSAFNAVKVATPDSGATRNIFRSLNVHAIRRSFPQLWAEYLRANFTSPGQVNKAFPGVDEKTCRDWWHGKRDPSGSFVATVIARDPDAIAILGRTA